MEKEEEKKEERRKALEGGMSGGGCGQQCRLRVWSLVVRDCGEIKTDPLLELSALSSDVFQPEEQESEEG